MGVSNIIMNQFKRLSFDAYGCLLCLSASSRSEDPFTKTGAAFLTDDGRVCSLGYNGLKKGQKLENWMYFEANRDKKSRFFIHAEQNSLAFGRVSGQPHSAYLTMPPCDSCISLMAANGVKRIVCLRPSLRYPFNEELLNFHQISFGYLPKSELDVLQETIETMLVIVKSI